ncbi:MAG: 4,5-DOPA dioxygenase extradiol [Bacteroidota bacterium]|nr:4,5-DOPA dioxygenase extradiol [Bacteroidota bacterium]
MKREHFLKLLASTPFAASAMKLNEFDNITKDLGSSPLMPVLFVGHGNPMNALWDNPFTQSLKKLGEDINEIENPKAILMVSAHWLTNGTYVQASPKPQTIHDFGGFPKELFDMQYPAVGSPEFANQVTTLLTHAKTTEEWGLDHGAWSILKHIYPAADVPVFQLSIDYSQPMQYHFSLSKQLCILRERGVLIIGSGNIVHNLRMSFEKFAISDSKPYDWAVEFDEWVKMRINDRNFTDIIAYEKAGKSGSLAVPTPDHYIPLLYSVALTEPNEKIEHTYEEVSFGGMSMRTIKIG